MKNKIKLTLYKTIFILLFFSNSTIFTEYIAPSVIQQANKRGYLITPESLIIQSESINDFTTIDQNIINTLTMAQDALKERIENRKKFIETNTPELIDFLNVLIKQKILFPDTSFYLEEETIKNNWCIDTVLPEIIKNFLNTGKIKPPEYFIGNYENYLEIIMSELLTIITKGPNKIDLTSLDIKNPEKTIKNIENFQKKYVLDHLLFFTSNWVIYKGRGFNVHNSSNANGLFTIMVHVLDLYTENKAKIDDFVHVAQRYHRLYPQKFEQTKEYLYAEIKLHIAKKLQTNNPKILETESLKIMRKITKKQWEFWK